MDEWPDADSAATVRSIFRAAPVGIGLVANRVLLRINDRICEMVGYEREELIGKNARVLYACDEDFNYVGEEKYRQIKARGTGTVETRWRRKDGRMIDVLLSSTPLDPDDLSKGVTFTALNITDRKRDRRALRSSEERFRMLVEATSDWIWEIDAEGMYTYCSPKVEDLLGYSPEELVGRSPFELMVPEEAERVRRVFEGFVAQQRPFSGLLNRNVHRDGREVVLETSGVPVIDDEGRLLGYRGIDRDVTRRTEAEAESRRLEERLRHAQKMEAVGQLAGGVAHDFNNLLHAIQGHTDLALADLETDLPAARESLNEVDRAAARAAALVRQLLAFSRREPLRPKFIDLNDTVADLMKMLRRVIGEHIELVISSREGLPTIFADPGQIEQILANICVNARDAMPGGGRLSIETDLVTLDAAKCRGNPLAAPGEHVLLRVEDTGCGMPEAVLERIFEPFFTTKGVGEGTGLGLATVYAIVERHAGVIEAESEEGRGTVFSIFLPVSEGPELEVGQEAPLGDLSGRGETILLAEDDDLVRGLAINVLERAGYRVLVARDGQEALVLFGEHKASIALCLLDVVMPRRSGYDLYQEIVAERPALPVIFSSGYAFQRDGSGGPDGPNVRQIQKPFPPRTLLGVVRELLDR